MKCISAAAGIKDVAVGGKGDRKTHDDGGYDGKNTRTSI